MERRTVTVDLGDLNAFVAVARARGFRHGARASGGSASGLSEAVRRLEARLGVRLLHRTTRSIAPTEAGAVVQIGREVRVRFRLAQLL